MLNTTIHTLIFDLDNTLIDRNSAMQRTMDDWLLTQGYEGPQKQSALNDIMQYDNWGYTDRLTFCTWLLQNYAKPHSGNTTPQQLLQTILQNIVHHIQPNPSVNAAMQAVSTSFRCVLATNGGGSSQRGRLRQAQLDPYFQPNAIFVSGEMGTEKPDLQFYQKIIHDLQLDPASAMMIGDNPVNDIQAAQACGLQTCWVSHDREPSGNTIPNRIIKNITEIGIWRQQ